MKYFEMTVGGKILKFPITHGGTVIVDPTDPQEDVHHPRFDPVKPSASTRRSWRLRELRNELTALAAGSPRREAIEGEIAVLSPIVNFEKQRYFHGPPKPQSE